MFKYIVKSHAAVVAPLVYAYRLHVAGGQVITESGIFSACFRLSVLTGFLVSSFSQIPCGIAL